MKFYKQFCFTLLVTLSAFTAVKPQGLTIPAGATFTMNGSTLYLPGNWSNSGAFDAGNGTVVFNSSGLQTITSTSEDVFYNLVVDKAAGNVQLTNNIIINSTLTLTSGDFDINSNLLTLGSNASLVETSGNILIGGNATTTRTLNAPSSVNVMGAVITSAENLGSTIITRGYGEYTSGGNTSILRNYEISPSNNINLNATLIFNYDHSELNGLNESELTLFRSTNSGTNWQSEGGIVDTDLNTVTLSNISAFSLWTLGASSTPLPVELSSFTVSVNEAGVVLKWATATEINNYGFEIQRSEVRGQRSELGQQSSTDSHQWENITFIKGFGNSNSIKEYSFVDKEIKSGIYLYRLKQVDNDGTFTYSAETEIEVKAAPSEFNLSQNYPNPFNPETSIEFSSDKNENVTLKIFNSLGEEIKILFSQQVEAGKYYHVTFNASGLASGVYYAKLTAGDKQKMKKMLLMK